MKIAGSVSVSLFMISNENCKVISVLRRHIGQCAKFRRTGSSHLSNGGRRKSSTMFSTIPDFTLAKAKGAVQKPKDHKTSNGSKPHPETFNLIPVQYKKENALHSPDEEDREGFV